MSLFYYIWSAIRRDSVTGVIRKYMLLSAFIAVTPLSAEEYQLIYSAGHKKDHPFAEADLKWIKHIENKSQERLIIRPIFNSLLLADDNNLHHLAKGVADISVASNAFSGLDGVLLLSQSNNYAGLQDPLHMPAIFAEMLEKFPELTADLPDVQPLVVSIGVPYHLFTIDKPVRTLKDIKGLRLKAGTAPARHALRKLGAEVVSLPMSDTFAAIDKGVIDGVVAPLETLNTFLLADIVNYVTYLPGYSGPSISRYTNKKALSSLPPDVQEIFLSSSNTWSTAIYQTRLEHDEIGRKLAIDRDVEFIAITEEEIAVYKNHLRSYAAIRARQLDQSGYPASEILNAVQEEITKYNKH